MARAQAVAGRPARIGLRRVGKDFVDAEGAGRDGQRVRLDVAQPHRAGRDIVKPRRHGSSRFQAGLAGRRLADMPGDLVGHAHLRQRFEGAIDPKHRQRVTAVALGLDVGIAGAGLGEVGRHRAGQLETQPVLAGQHMAERGEPFRLMILHPCQQGHRRESERRLPDPRQRFVPNALPAPALYHTRRTAIQ